MPGSADLTIRQDLEKLLACVILNQSMTIRHAAAKAPPGNSCQAAYTGVPVRIIMAEADPKPAIDQGRGNSGQAFMGAQAGL